MLPNIQQQSTDLTTLEQLYVLQDIMTSYVQKNYELIGFGAEQKRVSFINPNLYRIAVQYYGDANLWTAIANANVATILGAPNATQIVYDQLPDPNLIGSFTLIIPPKPASVTGGILQP